MSDSRRLGEILAEARPLAPDARRAYLKRACTNQAERAEIESLLSASETMGGFLEQPAAKVLAETDGDYEPGDRVGGYEIERLLGRGGSGSVYVALQGQPHRRVALKVMAGGVYSASALERFRAEAEILGRLKHPHVAHVYEAGVSEQRPFLALEYVDGAQTLLQYAASENLDRRARLMLFVSVCDAVHHGHQKGVIHRDVKPGNVLVDPAGRPKLIDFGIARADDGPTREVVGTPPYMSPEQCELDRDVDLRADVYALGVVCQELLTGRAPHRVTGVPAAEAMRRLREDEPETPSAADRTLRGDLDAILSKATRRDREERYPSASALAADVRRHLRAFPVEARDGGVFYHVACFARRHRGVFTAGCALVVVLVIAALMNRSLANEREQERQEAEWQASLANLAAATGALRVHDVSEAKLRLKLVPKHLRNWEWDHLWSRTDRSVALVQATRSAIWSGVVSPDGNLVAAIVRGDAAIAEQDNALHLMDRRTGSRRVFLSGDIDRRDCAAFDPQSRVIAVGHGSGKIRWHALDDGHIVRTIDAHDKTIIDMEFAANGTLVTGSRDKTAKVWNRDGSLRYTLTQHTDRVIGLAISADDTLLATGDRAGVIRIWNLASGALRQTITGHTSSVEGLAFSPDGERLASASRDQSFRLWRLSDGSMIAKSFAHEGNVRDVAALPNGRFVSASWDGTLRVWHGVTGRALGTLAGHESRVVRVGVDRTRERIVSFSMDGSVRFWRWDDVESVRTLRAHKDRVSRVAFLRDGTLLASGSDDRALRIWSLETGAPLHRAAGLPRLAYLERVDANTLIGGVGGWLRKWTIGTTVTHTDRRVPTLSMLANAFYDRARKRLFLPCRQRVAVVDAKKLQVAFSIPVGAASVTTVTVSTDGKRLYSVGGDHTLRVIDIATRRILRERQIGCVPMDLAVVGRELVVPIEGAIHIVDGATLATKRTLASRTGAIYAIAVSPDGSRIASGGFDRALRLWDYRTGQSVAVLRGHRFPIFDIQFSPDGDCIASCDGSTEDVMSSIKIWERHRRSS